jgi:hypothetical protein
MLPGIPAATIAFPEGAHTGDGQPLCWKLSLESQQLSELDVAPLVLLLFPSPCVHTCVYIYIYVYIHTYI